MLEHGRPPVATPGIADTAGPRMPTEEGAGSKSGNLYKLRTVQMLKLKDTGLF